MVIAILRFSVLFVLCIAGIHTAGHAQQTDTAVIPLGKIVARGVRPVASAGAASALEVNIDSLRTAPAPTIEEILRRVPLVQVRINSRGEAQFSLRGSGSDARQVAVLIDGIPVNLGWDHRADLSILPAGAASSITVARGLPSLLYGPNVLGGVVEIAVAAPQQANNLTARIDAAVDHTGARTIAAQASAPIARARSSFVLRGGAAFRERSGFALPANTIDPNANNDERANSDYTQTNAFAAARYETDNGGWLSASMLAFDVARGIPAELHISAPRYWRYPDVARLMTLVGAGTGERVSPFGGTGQIDLRIGADLARTRIDQFDSPAYERISEQETSRDRTFISRLRVEQGYGGTGRLQGAFTYADIDHDETLTPGGNAAYRQRLWSGAIEISSALAGMSDYTRVSLGVALDGADTPETGGKPALSALGKWGGRAGITSMIARGWMVHGGASWRARFPALRELYSGALGRFEPNPELQPELLRALEAGTSYSTPRAQLHAVAFHHILNDAIVRISQDGRFKRVNRDRQDGRGVELLAAAQLGQTTLSADLVLQRTLLRDEAEQEQLTAEYQPSVIAGAGIAAPLPFEIRFDGTSRFVGRQQCINQETGSAMDLAASGRMDAQLSRSWDAGWRSASTITATAAVDNATNALQYDQCGLPQPGRTFRLQMSLRY